MRQKHLGILVFLVITMITSVLATGCIKEENEAQIIEDINAKEAFSLIQENKNNPDFIIIDVRTPREFVEGHIENALNIDFNSGTFRDEIYKLDKAKKYLIYCRSGNRSRRALSVMTELGFKEVYHFSEGIIGWTKAGYTVVK